MEDHVVANVTLVVELEFATEEVVRDRAKGMTGQPDRVGFELGPRRIDCEQCATVGVEKRGTIQEQHV